MNSEQRIDSLEEFRDETESKLKLIGKTCIEIKIVADGNRLMLSEYGRKLVDHDKRFDRIDKRFDKIESNVSEFKEETREHFKQLELLIRQLLPNTH